MRATYLLPRLSLLPALFAASIAGAVTFSDPPTALPFDIPYNVNMEGRVSGAADANNDGRADVLMYGTDHGAPSESGLPIYLYEQQPDGTMVVARKFSGFIAPGRAYGHAGMLFADLDEDGFAEIGMTDGDQFVFLGRTPSGPYVPVGSVRNPFATDHTLLYTIARDLDNDGHVDLMLVAGNAGIAIFRGHGTLQFDAPTYVMAYDRSQPQFADLDGDGRQEMMTGVRPSAIDSRGGIATHTGLPAPDFFGRSTLRWDLPGDIHAPSIGDFDGDGDLDIAAHTYRRESIGPNTVQGYDDIRVFLRQADGTYREGTATTFMVQSNPPDAQPLIVADLDQDGDDDVIAIADYLPRVLLAQDGTFSLVQTASLAGIGGNYQSWQVADFNGDGCLDIGVASRYYWIRYRTDCPTHNPYAPVQSMPVKALRSAKKLAPKKSARRAWWRFW